MADDPIVIDDGGSTRIKLMLKGGGVGEMDTLLDVKEGVPVLGSSGSTAKIKAKTTSYSQLKIVRVAKDGTVTEGAQQPFTNFEIISRNFKISGALTTNPGLKDVDLTVEGVGTSEPNVESKQTKGQRRYVVSNSPPIDQVKINGTSVYTAAADIVYTSVFIT